MSGTLSAHRLGFVRDRREILTDVSVDVAPGTFTGLLGANGAGKTTLLRLMLGLLNPTHGTVMLGGRPIAGMTRRTLASQIAYVPQAHVAAFPFTVAEVVAMGRTPAIGWNARPTETDRKKVADALSRTGMTGFADRSYAALSGGERQAVLIARALAQGARILLLDEPTASLDVGQTFRVMQMLAALAREGYAILMSVHQPELALNWCNRALILQAGQILAQGAPSETLTAEKLTAVYGVAMRRIRVEDRYFILPEQPTGM